MLSVTYEHPDPHLPEDLFVKFSRDLDDELRDRGKRQMESEVRFGLLSQIPDFPVAVPRCLFGEYHLESGSGVLISERIAFGADGIEPHHRRAATTRSTILVVTTTHWCRRWRAWRDRIGQDGSPRRPWRTSSPAPPR